jgi:tetratricopeptide (TPR) repeat protein
VPGSSAARFDYFLTYARSDAAAARELVHRLENFGIKVASDFGEGGLRSGETWIPQLEELLRASGSYLILVGERDLGGWVQAELEVALNSNAADPAFRIVPLLLPGVSPADLPPFLGRFEVIPLAEDWRLAGSVSLARLAAKLRPPREGTPRNPFPGLRAFDASMSAYFFGRSKELQELLRLLGRTPSGHRRWLQIEGASGSGKSSLAQAGLLPAVETGLLAGAPPSFSSAVFRPGRQPLRSLAVALFREFEKPGLDLRGIEEALARDEKGLIYLLRENVPAGQGFLLLLDQLEELFSLAAGDLEPARRLGALLAAALEDEDGPFYLATTIRSDFLGELAKSPELVKHLNGGASRYLLPEISAAGLAEAVRQPALAAGLSWENESLPERIVNDAGLSPGSLPLVAHVLSEMWARDARGGKLLHETYDRLGGVGGALARSADALLESLPESERAIARKILLSLVRLQPGAGETRRVLGRDELLQPVGAAASQVLGRLSGVRDPRAPEDAPPPPRLLAVRADQGVELVHEALLRGWQTLRRLIDDNRKGLVCRNDAENAARAWDAAGRPPDGLPRGKQLAYFRQAELADHLTREFLGAATAAENREKAAHRKTRLAWRAGLAAAGLGLLAVLILGFWRREQLIVGFVASDMAAGLDFLGVPMRVQLEAADKVEERLSQLLGEPETDPYRLLLARFEVARGLYSYNQGKLDESSSHFERAIALAAAADPDDPLTLDHRLHALRGRGEVQVRKLQLDSALATAGQLDELLAAMPDLAAGSSFAGTVQFRIDLATGLVLGARFAEALAELEKAERCRQRLLLLPLWRERAEGLAANLGVAYNSVGQQAQRQGFQEAFDQAVAAIGGLKKTMAPRAFAKQQAQLLAVSAQTAAQRKDDEQAEAAYRQIPELFAGTDYIADAADRAVVFNALVMLFDRYFATGRPQLARQALADATALLERCAELPKAGFGQGELEGAHIQLSWRRGVFAESAGQIEPAWNHFQEAANLAAASDSLDSSGLILKYQRLAALERMARLADRHGWKDRLKATVDQATEVFRGYPQQGALRNDANLSFLMARIKAS